MKETDCQKKFSLLRHSVTKRHAGANPFSSFVQKMLGKISVLKYYSRHMATQHMIVWQLILIKITEDRVFTNSESVGK